MHDRTIVVEHCDYPVVWKKIASSLQALYDQGGKMNRYALSLKGGDDMGFFGIKHVGSQVERLIFRNGNPEEMPQAWVEYVMQHRSEIDISDYIKPRLMKGPWSQ